MKSGIQKITICFLIASLISCKKDSANNTSAVGKTGYFTIHIGRQTDSAQYNNIDQGSYFQFQENNPMYLDHLHHYDFSVYFNDLSVVNLNISLANPVVLGQLYPLSNTDQIDFVLTDSGTRNPLHNTKVYFSEYNYPGHIKGFAQGIDVTSNLLVNGTFDFIAK